MARLRNTIWAVALALVVALGVVASAQAADPPIPCEWFPVDPENPDGEWFQPLLSDECEPPFVNEPVPVAPRMTLPPTDTEL